MAQNYRQPGDSLTLTVGATTVSGDVVVVGSLIGVIIAKDANDNTKASVGVTGVYQLTSSGAIAQGAKVYWDATNKHVTGTAGSNAFLGHAIVAAASNLVDVRLQQSA